MILSIGAMPCLMEIFIGLEDKERGQIFSFSFSRKFNRSTSAHFHITVRLRAVALNTAQNLYYALWQLLLAFVSGRCGKLNENDNRTKHSSW